MKSLNIAIIILFTIVLGACRFQSQKLAVTSLQSYFTYAENREVLISAHRGGKGYAGYPENCLETMQYVKKHIPAAIFEIDVAKSKDGVFLLMHDDALERTSTGFGKVKQNSWGKMSQLKLKDDFGVITDFKIPLFKEVLNWAKKENAILSVDIKRSVSPEMVLHFIEENDALQHTIIITYSIKAAQQLYRLNPEVVLSVTIRNMDEFRRAANSGIPWRNMVAFTGTKESAPALYAELHKKGVMCMLGTLGNLDKKAATKNDILYKEWAKRGIDIFATDRALEVQKALRNFR